MRKHQDINLLRLLLHARGEILTTYKDSGVPHKCLIDDVATLKVMALDGFEEEKL